MRAAWGGADARGGAGRDAGAGAGAGARGLRAAWGGGGDLGAGGGAGGGGALPRAKDMAVLCRTAQLLQPFADALASLGVASRIQGGGSGGGGQGEGAGQEAGRGGKPAAKGRKAAAAAAAERGGAVTLSTIHRAKGLEWQAVWLPCLEDNILPHERSVAEAAGAGETLGLGMG